MLFYIFNVSPDEWPNEFITFSVHALSRLGHDLRCETAPRVHPPHWMKFHNLLASEMSAQNHSSSTFPKLILYGDSITERWRGTSIGQKCDRCQPKKTAPIFRTAFTERYGSAVVMAIAGDTTGQLLWRLRHGEAPPLQPRSILLHIGINDLGQLGAYCSLSGNCKRNKRLQKSCRQPAHVCTCAEDRAQWRVWAESVFLGIKRVIEELWRRVSAPIILTTLFPTGAAWPGGPFGEAVPIINRLLHGVAEHAQGALQVVDCAVAVLNNETGRIDKAMMPDFLHPSPRGMQRWARCIAPTIDRVLRHAAAAGSVGDGNEG